MDNHPVARGNLGLFHFHFSHLFTLHRWGDDGSVYLQVCAEPLEGRPTTRSRQNS